MKSPWYKTGILLIAIVARAGIGGEGARPRSVDEHTVALLHFDETQGSVARDASPQGHHAQFEKAPREPKWHEHGRFGGCLVLDGANADGNGDGQGDADGMVWTKGATPEPEWPGFTVEMWVRHAHLQGWQIYMWNSGGFGLVAKKDRLYSGFKPAGSKWVEVWAKPCLKPDRWQHVALTYDGRAARLFCDGIEVGRTDVEGKVPSGALRTVVGHDGDLRPSQIRGVCGLIDELSISRVARTDFPRGPHKPEHPLPAVLDRTVSKVLDFIEPEPVVREVTVTGAVFEDANGNGKRDPGEKGLAGVWVTDGETIGQSDADGSYALQFGVDEHRAVYITLPNGYKAASPWYRLVRQEERQTTYQFDFALQPDPSSLDRDFAFLVTADSQFSSEPEGLMLKADMAQITRSTGRPRFHFICGDLTMTGWLREWKWYADAMSALTIPSYDVFGGHGGNYGPATRLKRRTEHHFNLFCGPSYYSWNYGGRHFVVYNSLGGSFMSEGARARQGKWMRANLDLLEPGAEVILIAHYPINIDGWRKDLKHVATFYGHWHENNLFYYNGTPHICTNAIRGKDWGSLTRTVRFCQFKEGKLFTELRPTGQYKRVELVLPQEGLAVSQGVRPLRVIAFDTASRVSKVGAEILSDGRRIDTIALERLGQFTWGSDWDTSRMRAGSYQLRVAVEDDRPESWPVKQCTFAIAGQPVVEGTPSEDWPMIFKSLEELRTIGHEVKPPLDLVWSVPTGGRNQWGTSPIVYRGRVYVGQEDLNVGDFTPTIQCYDGSTGRRMWQTDVDACIRLSMAAGDGRIYAQTNAGTAYCLDAETGQVVWQQALYPRRCNPDDSKCAVLLDRGRLIAFGEYGPLTVLDAKTGNKLASWPRPGSGSRIYYGGPFPHGGRIYVSTLWGAFACDLMTGEPVWQAECKSLVKRGVSMGIVHDGVYYLRGYGGVVAFGAGSGKELWRVANGVKGGVPVSTVADGVLYVGGMHPVAIDTKTGKTRWSYNRIRGGDESNRRQTFAGFSSPLVSGEVLYLGRDDGDLVALNRHTGKAIWRFSVGVPIKSSPVVSGNLLFVCDFDGNLHAFASRAAQ